MLITPVLILLSLLSSLHLTSAQAEDDLICPDTSLQTFLLDLIDVLYQNGLTSFEELLATLSESDNGYNLLESLYTSSQLTILAPTDSALQSAGLYGPSFSGLSDQDMVDLVALHILSGEWGYDNLPSGDGENGIASSSLKIADYMNDTSGISSALQVAVLGRGGDGSSVVVEMASKNGTTWDGPLDLSGKSLGNLVILPVDTVIDFPPPLSTALTLATTSRSANGLNNLYSALNSSGGAGELEKLTSGGFTIFAPVDDAWGSNVQNQLNKSAPTILGNHYNTNYSLYSPGWTSTGSFPDFAVESGQSLSVTYNASGAYITFGSVSAKILRSDIALENGVMHIIDTVLVASDTTSSSISSTSSSTSSWISSSSWAPISSTSAASGTVSIPPGPVLSSSQGTNTSTTPTTLGGFAWQIQPNVHFIGLLAVLLSISAFDWCS